MKCLMINQESLHFLSKNKKINFIKVRAFDACTFVAFGAAQIGIAGEDVIKEFDYSEIYAPLELNIRSLSFISCCSKNFIEKRRILKHGVILE